MPRLFHAITILAALALAAAFPLPAGADAPQLVTSWWDAALKVRFPTSLAGLQMHSRQTYGRGDLDYSLNYMPDGESEQSVEGETLDVYVYTRTGRAATYAECVAEVRDVFGALKNVTSPQGDSELFVNTNIFMRIWGETGLTNAIGLCEFPTERFGARFASVCSVTSLGGRFVKLRYSLPVRSGDDVPARRFGEICCALDLLFAESIRRAKVDVYSAGGAEETLALLRSKWPDAGERVSQWLMPGWAEKVERLCAAQRWCVEDFANRVDQFERISREGIETNTDPALWYYNLACALSVKKCLDDAVEALEQAVAAGFTDAAHASGDEDFANLRADPRFGKLVAAMKAAAAAEPSGGLEPLRPEGGECIVGEDNVAYDFSARTYRAAVVTSDRKMVMYVNKNDDHSAVPCEGLTVPSFEEDAYDAGALGDSADVCFSYDPDGKGRDLWCPTIVACAESDEGVMSSIPAMLASNGEDANVEMSHEQWNVLGVYSAKGFGDDGTDPFSCWCPGFIAHTGGADEGDKFVRLSAEIIRALPFAVVEKGFPVGQIVQKIVRASQRGVDGEEGFMSGLAMRPVVDFADIDEDRALAAAKAVDPERLQPLSPFFVTAEAAFPATFVGDCADGISLVSSAHHAGFVASWAERTAVIDVKFVVAEEDCGVEWRVLSGDAGRIRFESPEAGRARIYVDYHEVFDEDLPSGRKLRSGRVDVGCFAVRGGVASMPSILSVYFPPTERREYSSDGRLRSVDYMSAKFEGELPGVCPKGDWRDELHYGEDGAMTGWTRYRASGEGGVVTDEFTSDGLVVMTRDEKHRPLRCRRDLRSAWRQMVPEGADAEQVAQKYEELSAGYDSLEDHPCGRRATTLVWEYEYGKDGKGSPKPVAPVPFRYRPELCPYADFGGEAGVRLPIAAQMRLGYEIYSQYKSGRTPSVTERPTKLKFAKMQKQDKPEKPAWPMDTAILEDAVSSRLRELGDGVYRATTEDNAQPGGEKFFPVDWTYMTINRAAECLAFSRIGARYARCSEPDVLAELASRTNELDLAKLYVNNDAFPIMPEDLPDGKTLSCAMWKINESLRFGVLADFGDRFERRKYFFAVVGGERGEALTWDWFEDAPSEAIGETMLGAARHEPAAVNNLAVLMYAGICNPGHRSLPSVERLLEFAAKEGCAVADANLKALRGGEVQRAKSPPPPPELIGSMMGEFSPACDIWDERWGFPARERTPMRHVYCWVGAERTVCITATVEAPEGELKWKVLQGDPGKVRFVRLGNGTGSVRVEIDWHGAYLARGRDGKARLTTRVEFGCVAVKDGLESEPCVVSVSASPHATREYDDAGRLRKISYVNPLLPDKVSSRFPLGDWEDTFEYSPNGQLVGWTRLRRGEKGDETERFTRDGLKILTYDAVGRPLRCERDYRATIYQRTARGERGDRLGAAPEFFEYRYSGVDDYLGRARPVRGDAVRSAGKDDESR